MTPGQTYIVAVCCCQNVLACVCMLRQQACSLHADTLPDAMQVADTYFAGQPAQVNQPAWQFMKQCWMYLFSNGIHMRAELSKSHISVLCHHACPIQVPKPLVWVGLKMQVLVSTQQRQVQVRGAATSQEQDHACTYRYQYIATVCIYEIKSISHTQSLQNPVWSPHQSAAFITMVTYGCASLLRHKLHARMLRRM